MTKRLFNPPPTDLRCQCCGKHVNELEVFGGNFPTTKFVKGFRAFLRGTDNEFVSASWECKHCFMLDDKAYHKTRRKMEKQHSNQ